MASEKRTPARKAGPTRSAPLITPMPFPGESPTVSLALAAGRMYGFHPEDGKPARAKPRRKAAKKPSKPARRQPARKKRAATRARAL